MNTPENGFDDELITAYLDGELDSRQHERVERLLRQNAEYRRMADELRALREELRLLPRFRLSEDFHARVLHQAESVAEAGRRGPASDGSPASREQPSVGTVQIGARVQSRNWRGLGWGLASLAALVLIMFMVLPPLGKIRHVAQRPPGLPNAMSEADEQHDAAGISDRRKGTDNYGLDSVAQREAQLASPENEPTSPGRQEAYRFSETAGDDLRAGPPQESAINEPVSPNSASGFSADSAFYKRDTQPGLQAPAPTAELGSGERSDLRLKSADTPAARDGARTVGQIRSAAIVDRSDGERQWETAATHVLEKVAVQLNASPRGLQTADILPSVQATDEVDVVVDVALSQDDQNVDVLLDAAQKQLLSNLNSDATASRFVRSTVGRRMQEGDTDGSLASKPFTQALGKRVLSPSNEQVQLIYAEVSDERIKAAADDFRQRHYDVSEVAVKLEERLNQGQAKELVDSNNSNGIRGLGRQPRPSSQFGAASVEAEKERANTRDRPTATDEESSGRYAPSDRAAGSIGDKRREAAELRKGPEAASEPASDDGKSEATYAPRPTELNGSKIQLRDEARGGVAGPVLTREANRSAKTDAAEKVERLSAPVPPTEESARATDAAGRAEFVINQEGATGQPLRRVLFILRTADVQTAAESAKRSVESAGAASKGQPIPIPRTKDD